MAPGFPSKFNSSCRRGGFPLVAWCLVTIDWEVCKSLGEGSPRESPHPWTCQLRLSLSARPTCPNPHAWMILASGPGFCMHSCNCWRSTIALVAQLFHREKLPPVASWGENNLVANARLFGPSRFQSPALTVRRPRNGNLWNCKTTWFRWKRTSRQACHHETPSKVGSFTVGAEI